VKVARTVQVELGDRSYPIRIGADLLAKAGPEIARRTRARRAIVISVPAVGRRYAGRLTRSLREAGLRVRRLDVPDGERSKSLRQVARVYQGLLELGADRASVVVALGGGVVGDLAGFAAATFLRGIDFVQVPTTLLAMVDSSVGGKTGVNLPEGKNLVGAFHQPKLVLADTSTLRSLSPRQRANGLVEAIKKAAIWDRALFERIERDLEAVLALETEALHPVIERACAIKAEVVAQDERESGLRQLLNFGHTLGHAIERLARYRGILHGEAVAVGMGFAAQRSEELRFAPSGTARRVSTLLERAGLPTQVPEHPRRAYLEALRVDKKREDARIRFVMLRGIGRATTVPLRPEEILPPAFRRPVLRRPAPGRRSGRT
jgi:3-dehydroquinate synthase